MTKHNLEGYSSKEVVTAVLAWIVVIIFGFVLFLFSLYIAGVAAGDAVGNETENSILPGYMFASSGIVVLLPLIGLSGYILKRRKSVFVAQARAALSVGVVIYFLAMIAIVAGAYNIVTRSTSETSGCTSLEDQYSKAIPAVVPIGTDISTGTAFAVGDTSTLLTAYHVIEGASEVYANWTSGKVGITVVDTSPEFDLALLKIERPVENHLYLSKNYSVTDELYVYGWPGNTFDAGRASISKGVVSRILSEDDLKLNGPEAPGGLEIVQTDAAVNPGNSGGPVISRCGVVGVAQSISDRSELHEYVGVVSEQGISYAISSKTAAQRFNLPLSE